MEPSVSATSENSISSFA